MRLWYCLILSLVSLASAVATPDPPTALTICASGDSVTLRWSPSQGAVGYKVYFASALDGPISVLCETTDTMAVDSLLEGKRFYYVVATVPNTPPVFAPVPDQPLVEDSLQASPINLRAYITDESPFDELSFLIIQPAKLTLGLEDSVLSVLSLALDSNGLDSAVVHVTDPEGGTAERTIRYIIAERTDLRLMVWDFDRQAIHNAKIRVNDADYATTDGHVSLQVLPTDSVTVRAWRNTPSEWGNDTSSSYIRTRKLPAMNDRTDSVQVQTWDVCDSMNVSPTDYKAFISEARGRGIRINGQVVEVLGGINPQTINLDTLWYGKIHPTTGDTTYDWQQDSLQAEAQRLKDTQLFPDSPYPNYYQATFADTEPWINGYGVSRQHLHVHYMEWACTAGLLRDIPNNACTTRSYTTIEYSMLPWCIMQELETVLACTNPAVSAPAMMGKTIIHEYLTSWGYTYADKELLRVWNQTPPNTRPDIIYGLP